MKTKKIISILIAILLLILTIYVLILIHPTIRKLFFFICKILLPFIIGFSIAYILQPIVNYLQKKVKKRTIAVIIVVSILLIILFVILYTLIPIVKTEIKELINNFPEILAQIEMMVNTIANKFDFLPIDYRPTFENINELFSKYINKLSDIPQKLINKFIDYFSLIVIIPITVIYFLLDYEKILCKLRNYLVEHNKINFKNFLGELNQKIFLFFKGSLIIIIIMFITTTLAFMIIDLKYPLFFGLIVALTNIIPYIGPYIGAVFPVVFALLSSPTKALIVIIIIFVIQTIESNFLTPYIQSKQIESHPLLVILCLLIFGSLFGIIGMILAVPLLSVIKTIIKYYPLKKKTYYYIGGE